ncbi:unnamed protein product [Calicophoron daubneyi]|uniref:Gamma-cystathionase n=1 Tax=Calicophoron daubneyi TaxID=300641 RepID=A0AAV2TAT2_CALDB
MEGFNKAYLQVSDDVTKKFDAEFRMFPGIQTRTTHGGYECCKAGDLGRPVIPPIALSANYEHSAPGVTKYNYVRLDNFTRGCLEECIANLEEADHCSVFGSGLAALGSLLQLLSSGDHIVAFDDLYGGTSVYLRTIAVKAGLKCTQVDMRNTELFKSALRENTRLVLIETPSNPLMRIVDIKKIADIAHQYNKDIVVAVDNTFSSSYFQHPLDFGADVCWYSLTKYMNGHSDVLMGAVVTRNRPDLATHSHTIQMNAGAVPSPFDCYLCLRGIRSLAPRMEKHMKNALIVAMMLERHPKVEKVLHPGLESHPQHQLALKQMHGYSGMVTVYLRLTKEQTEEFVKNLKIFTLAVSLGGFESLVEIPNSMTHVNVPEEEKQRNHITDNMVRLSVGLEDPKDLCEAIYEGLAAV